jgi:WD40 repeat protein/transcriptional regulator with XRE-family HTH domain
MGMSTDADSATPSPPRDFAEQLTRLRLARHLSVREVSKRTGIPSATLGGYFSGRHLPPQHRPEVLDTILAELGVAPEARAAWAQQLTELYLSRRSAPVGRDPYLGLDSYGTDDSDLFFGRDETVAATVRAVRDAGAGEDHVVTVLGRSGAGKSSLLRAGLVPALVGSDPAWHCVVTSPGREPLRAWAAAAEELESRQGRRPGVVVLDQFEELFTLTGDDQVRRAVLDRMLQWTRSPDARQRVVVLGVRADHFGHLSGYAPLLQSLRQRQVVVGPMGRDQLRRVIEGPPARVGLKLEPGLADVVLAEARRGEDAGQVLPHLSHVLDQMWQVSNRRELTVRDYRAVGSFTGAIQQSAEQAYTALSPEDQDVARTLILRMLAVRDDAEVNRRTLSAAELAGLGPSAERVLDVLVGRRLVTTRGHGVELSHEALIGAWPRLRAWVEEDRAELIVRDLVRRHTAEWSRHGHDDDLLLRGGRLSAVAEWAASHPGQLTQEEEAFVRAGERRNEQEATARERQHQRTRRLLAAAVALSLVTVVALGVAVWSRGEALAEQVSAESRRIAYYANYLGESNTPLAAQLAVVAHGTEQNADTSSALVTTASSPVLTRRVDDSNAQVTTVVDDSGVLAFGGADGTVDLTRVGDYAFDELSTFALDDAPAGARALGSVQALAAHPRGHQLAVAGGVEHVRVVDVSDPARPTVLQDLDTGGPVLSVAFSPDGLLLVAATDTGGVAVWEDVAGTWVSRPALTDLTGSVRSVVFAEDGGLLAAGSGSGEIGMWRFTGGAAELVHTEQVGAGSTSQFGLAFNRDATLLAAAGRDKTVRVFQVDGQGALTPEVALPEFSSWVNTVQFSLDGTLLVAGSSDRTVRTWRVTEEGEVRTPGTVVPMGAPVTDLSEVDPGRWSVTTTDVTDYLWTVRGPALPTHRDIVFTTRFSTQGERMLTAPGVGDGRLHLWDARLVAQPVRLTTLRAPEEHGTLNGAGAISHDGTMVAGGTDTGSLVVWDVTDPLDPEVVYAGDLSEILLEQVDFAPDGGHVAAAGDDGQLHVIDLATLEHRHEPVDVGAAVMSVATGPRGLVATGAVDGTATLWSVDDPGRPVATLQAESIVFGVDFAPATDLVAVGGADNVVRVYDITDPAAPRAVGEPLVGPTDTVYSIQFSPDGTRIAAAALDGSVWLWRRAGSGTFEDDMVLRATDKSLTAVGWSGDGSAVAAGGHDGWGKVWILDPRVAAEHICRTTGDAITPEEWDASIPEVDYAVPCEEVTTSG